jgi:hypothetical protein
LRAGVSFGMACSLTPSEKAFGPGKVELRRSDALIQEWFVRQKTKQSSDGEYGLDLVASGSSGKWSVLISETHTGPAKWFMQTEGPSICFSFELLSSNILEKLLLELDQRQAQPKSVNAKLLLGMSNRTRITLLRDDEYVDRCFLMAGSDNTPIVRYSITGTDLLKLTDAVKQAAGELGSEYRDLSGNGSRRKSRSASSASL